MAQTGAAEGNFLHTIRAIIKNERLLGLWKGNGANCLRSFPQKGILFATNDYFKAGFRSALNSDSALVSCLSGSAAGITASAATFPLDVTRMRISATKVEGTGVERRSFRVVMVDIFQKEGARGLYRGIRPTLLGAVPYEGIKFGAFDGLQNLWKWTFHGEERGETREGGDGGGEGGGGGEAAAKIPLYGKLMCGATAGIAAGMVMYPNDTVRRRMQVAGAMGGGADDRVFTGILDCARDTYRRGGIPRFYRGLTTYLVRMVPNAAIQFFAYDFCKELMSNR